MGLVAHYTKHNMCADLFESRGPINIRFLVKPGHEFYDDSDFFSRASRDEQGFH